MMDLSPNTANFLEGAMRGGAAALRGYMEAKVAVAQARNDSERQAAESALVRERNNLLKVKQNQDFWLGQEQIRSAERIAESQQQTEQFRILTTADGQKYIVDAQGRNALAVAQEQGATAERVAETGADAQRDVATTGAAAQKAVAQTGADAQRDVATTQAGAQVQASQGQADASVKAAQIGADAVVDVANIESEAAQRVAEVENKVLSGVGGKPTVSAEAQRIFQTALRRVAASPPYKILESSQNVVPRMLALGANGRWDAADDLALVNMFQRMIDPGVSVREGDVQLQQSTQAAWSRFELAIKRVQEGALLSPDLRRDMVSTAIELANEDYRVLLPRLQAAGNNELAMNAELAKAGYDISDFFLQPLQEFPGEVVLDERTGAVSLVAGAGGLDADGKMAQQGATQAGGSDEAVVSRVRQLINEGRTPVEVRTSLVAEMERKGYTPERQQALLSAVATAMGWSQTDFLNGTGEFAGGTQ